MGPTRFTRCVGHYHQSHLVAALLALHVRSARLPAEGLTCPHRIKDSEIEYRVRVEQGRTGPVGE